MLNLIFGTEINNSLRNFGPPSDLIDLGQPNRLNQSDKVFIIEAEVVDWPHQI